MHDSVFEWVGKVVEKYDLAGGPTLEVGSCDVNGSIRSLFTGEYVGVDVVDGPGVDHVMQPLETYLPLGPFYTIVSTEMLEHDEAPWVTLENMHEALVLGGHLILTCRGFDESGTFGYHNPPDRWRFGKDAMISLAEWAGFINFTVQRDPQAQGWFLHAKK